MVIFIYGDDSYRAWHKLGEIKKKFSTEVDATGSSLMAMEGAGFDVIKFREYVLSPALFARARMVIIKNLLQEKMTKKTQEQIIEIIKKAGDNVLVFWEQFGDKTGSKQMRKSGLYQVVSQAQFIQEFNSLSDTELVAWVRQRVEELGSQINKTVSKSLITLVGNDLWLLNNELIKLSLYKNGEEITNKDLDVLVKARIDNDIWQFTDSLGRNNKRLALRLLNQQLTSGSSPGELLAKMIWQFRVLLLVKELMDKKTLTSSEAAKELSLHPYVVQKSLPLIKNFTIPKLHRVYQDLTKLDFMIKVGSFSPDLLLNYFIVKV